jgi:hypothetical protein
MAQLEDVTAGAAGRLPNGKSANSLGVHIELAGRAGQTATQWADQASTAILANAATLCREYIIPKIHTPIRRLTVPQMRALERGFVGHIDVTRATNRRGGHTDPGPAFPWQHFLSLIGGDVSETSILVFVAGVEVKDAKAWRDDEGTIHAALRPLATALNRRVGAVGPKQAEVLKGDLVEAVVPIVNRDGTGYVPVRELCKRLGLEPPTWDPVAGAVRIG